MLPAKFSAPLVLLFLIACSSGESVKRREAARDFERALRIGATKDDLRRDGGEVANCRGSGLSYERCEVVFWQGNDPVLVGPWNGNQANPNPVNFSQDNNRAFTLHFSNGKLERWEKADSTTLRSYPN